MAESPKEVTCDYQHPTFCDGLDVRRIQRIGKVKGVPTRGEEANWCKGCRTLNNGGFRYVNVGK